MAVDIKNVTPAQARLARLFEQAKLCSYSQALKAFARRDNAQIEAWKRQLNAASNNN